MMTLRQLISELTYLSQQDGFNPDSEVLVNLYDKNGDNIKDLSITDLDWYWSDPVDVTDTTKLVVIQAQMTE
jgi:hypothetical protein